MILQDRPLIIAAAINGSRMRKTDNLAVPYSAREIADEIVRAASTGAAIAHVHARTPDGEPSLEPDAFQEIVALVEERSDVIMELSLGSPGFSAEKALEPIVLQPSMVSFPMEIRNKAAAGGPSIEETTRMLVARGIRPSLAVTLESLEMVMDLVARGAAGAIPCMVVSVDPFNSLGEAAERLVSFTKRMPPEANWWIMKGGKSGTSQYALRALSVGLGGHVRVGFEDSVHTYDGAGLAPSNAWFVERMVELARTMGRPVAKPGDARRLLGLT